MSKRILIVDDDVDDQLLIQRAILEVTSEHYFIIANNGNEAINLVEQHKHFDIVLLDLNMPLMNGFDTLKIIKQLNSDIPVVIISTSSLTYDIERCKRLGADQYIVKPDTFTSLVNKLKHVLE